MRTQLEKINYAEELALTEVSLAAKIAHQEITISSLELSNSSPQQNPVSATEPTEPNLQSPSSSTEDTNFTDQEEIDRLTEKLTAQEMLQAEEEKMTAELEWLLKVEQDAIKDLMQKQKDLEWTWVSEEEGLKKEIES